MKILLDMNLQGRWVGFLAEFQIEAVHWSTVGPANAPDPEILAYAREHRYVVLTQDLDFGILLAMTRETSPSVIQIRSQDVRPETIGGAVVLALRNLEDSVSRGALLTVQARKVRYTPLPLR